LLNWQVVEELKKRLAHPEQEPVWIQPNHLQKARQAPFLCRVEPKQRDDFVPLYTAPPAPRRLTDEEIHKLRHLIDWTAHWSYVNFARAIEARILGSRND